MVPPHPIPRPTVPGAWRGACPEPSLPQATAPAQDGVFLAGGQEAHPAHKEWWALQLR